MKTAWRGAGIFCRLGCSIFGLVLALAAMAGYGQTNSWSNATSGNWEDPDWSAGMLPGAGQAIMFTNAGWKALAVDPVTTASYPQALSISSLTVSSPGTNTFNELLMNYSGLAIPLAMDSLSVGSNCGVVMLYSALEVTNAISLGGNFTQDVGSTVSAGSLAVEPGASYDLKDGSFAGSLTIDPGGTFSQTGGTTVSDASVNGTLLLAGGVFSGGITSTMAIPGGTNGQTFAGSGLVVQTGGTNAEPNLAVGLQVPAESQEVQEPPTDGGRYTLSNGVVAVSSAFCGANGVFDQTGGIATVNGTLNVHGALFYSNNILNVALHAYWELEAGSLAAQEISVGPGGIFTQMSGTNMVSGNVSLTAPSSGLETSFFYGGQYSLDGGSLVAPNIVVPAHTALFQAGGQISVGGLELLGGRFVQTAGPFTQTGTLTLGSGTLTAEPGNPQFGPVLLSSDPDTNSYAALPPGDCMLQFAASASLVWSNSARLVVQNWNGLLSGGGRHQVLFGSGGGALTPQQVNQIQFQDPANLPRGLYPAQILPNGEVVPRTSLVGLIGSHPLVIEWGPGWTLQTSTNLQGPYLDLSQATSPYTNQINPSADAQRYFRLRR